MNVQRATKDYDAWVSQAIQVNVADLKLKHQKMAGDDPFPFLRATYYRWAELFPAGCPHLQKSPVVYSVGDTHVENFGTWRDAESRPVWGMNDLDEADELPYTNDLVRLTTSFRFAGREGAGRPRMRVLAAAVLRGYGKSIEEGGTATILSEENHALGPILARQAADPNDFWAKLKKHSTLTNAIRPAVAVLDLTFTSAPNAMKIRFYPRNRVGLGSLGRPRLVAIGQWAGGRVIREIKARVPPATHWLSSKNPKKSGNASADVCQAILAGSNRASDPTYAFTDRWVIRRLAPDAVKIELDALQAVEDWEQLAVSMGQEIASIHLTTGPVASSIRRDLQSRGADWLHESAKIMAAATEQDWHAWRDR